MPDGSGKPGIQAWVGETFIVERENLLDLLDGLGVNVERTHCKLFAEVCCGKLLLELFQF
jgi:hypothetical protein